METLHTETLEITVLEIFNTVALIWLEDGKAFTALGHVGILRLGRDKLIDVKHGIINK